VLVEHSKNAYMELVFLL